MSDEIDWRAFVSDMGPSLYRYFAMTFDQARAEDLVQETLIRLFRKVKEGKFDPSRGHLRMYIYGIAHFVRIEGRRDRRYEEYQDGESHLPSLEDQMSRDQELRRLRLAISELTEIQQQVIGLCLDGESSLEEIGTLLDMPAATVRSHLHRAKTELTIKLVETKGVETKGVENE